VRQEKIELYFPDGDVTSVEVDASTNVGDLVGYLTSLLPSFSTDAFSIVLQTAGDIRSFPSTNLPLSLL
jgi:hypothetical protein